MEGLTGAVKLRNVSDYIAPNQACVVSLRGGKLSADDEEVSPHAHACLRTACRLLCADASAPRRRVSSSCALAARPRAA